MKNKKRYKSRRIELANKNINNFFNLLQIEDLKEHHKKYAKTILEFIKSFNIRLTREQKLTFCKECYAKWPQNCIIRLNSKTKCKEYICTCGYIKRIKYKK